MSLAGIVATWFGVGRAPCAPGTAGSLAALPFAWLIALAGGWPALALAAAAVTVAGIVAATSHARLRGLGDPQDVVVDEVAGQWVALLGVPLDPWFYAGAFLLFRLADIVKPWPASWAERSLPGGFGIMLDDTVAGLYAMAAMHLIIFALGR